MNKTFRNIALVMITSGAIALSGCTAIQTGIKKRNLDVQTKMSETIFLEPVSASSKVIYVNVRNTSDKDFDIGNQLKSALQQNGYQVTSNPEKARFMVQANILQVGKSDLRDAHSSLESGFGGAVMGITTATMLGGNVRTGAGAALVGGVLGVVGDALVDDVLFSATTDLQIRERPMAGEVIRQSQVNNARQGTSSNINQQISGGKAEWKIYRTRIVSTANKVNLKFEEAEPELKAGLVRSIAGIFVD